MDGIRDEAVPMAWADGRAGDGAGAESPSGGEELLGALLTGVIWLLPVSPYLCMAGGAFNLIEGKSLRVAYVYALVVLALTTLIMLMSFQRLFEWMALGNIVVGGLWAFSFRGTSSAGNEGHPNDA